MPPVMDEALCIRQWDWSETSQTVSLLTRGHGLVRALAKGSRRPKSVFSGGVELLTRGRCGVIVRPSSDLALLTEWDLAQTFPALRSTLAAHNAGLYIADLILHALHDHDPHPALYDAAVRALTALVDGVGPALLALQWAVLVETGYRPVLDTDATTGRPLPLKARAFRFDPTAGGLHADSPESPGWRVRAETVAALRSLDAERTGPGITEESVDRANRLLASYLRHVLGTEPRTMPVVFGPGLER